MYLKIDYHSQEPGSEQKPLTSQCRSHNTWALGMPCVCLQEGLHPSHIDLYFSHSPTNMILWVVRLQKINSKLEQIVKGQSPIISEMS